MIHKSQVNDQVIENLYRKDPHYFHWNHLKNIYQTITIENID